MTKTSTKHKKEVNIQRGREAKQFKLLQIQVQEEEREGKEARDSGKTIKLRNQTMRGYCNSATKQPNHTHHTATT